MTVTTIDAARAIENGWKQCPAPNCPHLTPDGRPCRRHVGWGECLHRGCHTVGIRDIYGLCPEHHPGRARNPEAALVGIQRCWPATAPADRTRTRPITCTPDDFQRARTLLDTCTPEQYARLRWSVPRVPNDRRWKTILAPSGHCHSWTWLGGIAVAIARGELVVIEGQA